MTNFTEPRTGMPTPRPDESEFKRRFLAQFNDPAFVGYESHVDAS
jgi:hypothetical protein